YKWPSGRAVLRRLYDSGWAFLRRAGTVILATMVVVWAALYFPAAHPDGGPSYPERIATAEESRDEERVNELQAEWKKQSYLGRLGQWIEPAVRPLGWDWRVGVATLASFPAREVVVGTLGIVYQVGKVDTEEIRESTNVAETDLGKEMRKNL